MAQTVLVYNEGQARLLQGEAVESFVNPHVNVIPSAHVMQPAVAPAANTANTGAWKPPPTRLAPIPIVQRITFPALVTLLLIEIFGNIVGNTINEAYIRIEASGIYHVAEDVVIGWDQLVVTTWADDWIGNGKTFVYSNRCGEYDCQYCIYTNWCKIQTRGTQWYVGSWFRVCIAILCIIFTIIMGVRSHYMLQHEYNNDLQAYKDSNEYKSYKTPYYRNNKFIMKLFLLSMLIWTGIGVLCIYLWNHKNPIYDFDSVDWSWSLYSVCFETGTCALLLVFDLLDFCIRK